MALPSSIVGPDNPISLKKDTRYGLYVTMNMNQTKCTKVDGASHGDLFREDDNLSLYVGTKTDGWPFATTISSSPYVVNTFFKYNVIQERCASDDDCDNDGYLCTGYSECKNNICQPPTEPVTCDDSSFCTTDTCDPATGQCSFDAVQCADDGDSCTESVCNEVLFGDCLNSPIAGCAHLFVAGCQTCYSNNGNFFDVEAGSDSDLDIHTLTIKPGFSGTMNVRVYTKSGTWIGHDNDVHDTAVWTLVGEGAVDVDQWSNEPLPSSILSRSNPIRVPAGQKVGVLVLTSESVYYRGFPAASSASHGTLHVDDGTMKVYVGTRAEGYPYPTSISSSPYMYAGKISYDVVGSVPDPVLITQETDCSSASPCGLCTGDCDHDGHCTEGLVCFGRSDLTPVPGCGGSGVSGDDYCYPIEEAPSNQLLYTGDCSSSAPCGECEGDCDSDSQCGPGLLCKERSGLEDVPGCVGYGVNGKDYCYDPGWH